MKLLALVLLFAISDAIAASLHVSIPNPPIGPTSSSECSEFESRWQRLISEVNTLHSNCLAANQGCRNDSGGTCSCAACQYLHGFPDEALRLQKKYEVEACREKARVAEEQQRNLQREERQRQAEDNSRRRQIQLTTEQWARQRDLEERQAQTSARQAQIARAQYMEQYKAKQRQDTIDRQQSLQRQMQALSGGDGNEVSKAIIGLFTGGGTIKTTKEPVGSSGAAKYDAIADSAKEAHERLIQEHQSGVVNQIQDAMYNKIKYEHHQILAELDDVTRQINSLNSDVATSSPGATANSVSLVGTPDPALRSAPDVQLTAMANPWNPNGPPSGQDTQTDKGTTLDVNPWAGQSPVTASPAHQTTAVTDANPWADADQTSASSSQSLTAASNEIRFLNPRDGIEYVIPSGYTLYRASPNADLQVVRLSSLDTSSGGDAASGSCSPTGVGLVIPRCEMKRKNSKK